MFYWFKRVLVAVVIVVSTGCALKSPYPKQYAENAVVVANVSNAPMHMFLDGTYIFAPESERSGASTAGALLFGIPGAVIGVAIDLASGPKRQQVAMPPAANALIKETMRRELDKHPAFKSMVVSSESASHSLSIRIGTYLLQNTDQTTSLGLRFQTQYRLSGEPFMADSLFAETNRIFSRNYDWISDQTMPGTAGEGWTTNDGAPLVEALSKALDMFLPLLFEEMREGKLFDSVESAQSIRLVDKLAIERFLAPCLGYLRTIVRMTCILGIQELVAIRLRDRCCCQEISLSAPPPLNPVHVDPKGSFVIEALNARSIQSEIQDQVCRNQFTLSTV